MFLLLSETLVNISAAHWLPAASLCPPAQLPWAALCTVLLLLLWVLVPWISQLGMGLEQD